MYGANILLSEAEPFGLSARLRPSRSAVEISTPLWGWSTQKGAPNWPNAQVSAYFVSLSGFTESAIQQESPLGQRVVLVSGADVIERLIHGRRIPTPEEAVSAASRILPVRALRFQTMELWVYADELIWAVIFGRAGGSTHLVLVHSGGEPVHATLAEAAKHAAIAVGRAVSSLVVVSEPRTDTDDVGAAKLAYFSYLSAECGSIQLEGMPIDETFVRNDIRLEDLFVPLHLTPLDDESGIEAGGFADKAALDESMVAAGKPAVAKAKPPNLITAGQLLEGHTRAAILASPGAGKSTLLKRLAVAYAFHDRLREADDELPDQDRFPLFLRCRDLGDRVRSPLLSVLQSVIPEQANIVPNMRPPFDRLVITALQDGRAMLLVDGLDEIKSDGDRLVFSENLRVFSLLYPRVALVVTAREHGFRAVAGTLGSVCERFRIADLDEEDMRRLVLLWYQRLSPNRMAQASTVGDAIVSNSRLRILASTPLLLTTLLLVNRSIGQLPAHKAALYDKAIEVLLRTWNVQAHAPIDLAEALPRLEYLAYAMTKEGLQRVTLPRVISHLASARAELPEALAYSQISDQDFVDSVESRSSLLSKVGHQMASAQLVAILEFRHLAFQEFLAAKAIAQNHYPGRTRSGRGAYPWRSLVSDQHWHQVIPLVASIAGGSTADDIVSGLTKIATTDKSARRRAFATQMLAECLANEVEVVPEEAAAAIAALAINPRRAFRGVDIQLLTISGGRFGPLLRSVLLDGFRSVSAESHNFASLLATVVVADLTASTDAISTSEQRSVYARVDSMLTSGDPDQMATGALCAMTASFEMSTNRAEPSGEYLSKDELLRLGDRLASLLDQNPPHVVFAAVWALAWLSDLGWSPDRYPPVVRHLLALCGPEQPHPIRRQAAWATCWLPVLDRSELGVRAELGDVEGLEILASTHEQEADWVATPREAAIRIAYYLGAPWSLDELAGMVDLDARHRRGDPEDEARIRSFLSRLGPSGATRLESIEGVQVPMPLET
jgi:hypothetical protein